MRRIIVIATFFLLLAGAPADANTLIQVVVDHSGVLHDEQDHAGKSHFNQYLRVFLERLARNYRRDREDTQIRLISAVDPPYTVWSGSEAVLYRGGPECDRVTALVKATPNGCNNLHDALAEVEVNKSLTRADHNIVHIITSGVHSGAGCQTLTQDKYVNLVSNTDLKIVRQIGHVAGLVDQLSVHFLTSTQRRAFFEELSGSSPTVRLFTQGEEPQF